VQHLRVQHDLAGVPRELREHLDLSPCQRRPGAVQSQESPTRASNSAMPNGLLS
jgi:hypothetical protein